MNDRGFNIEPFCSDVCGDHRRPQTLAERYRNMDICCGFWAVAAREKISGVDLIRPRKPNSASTLETSNAVFGTMRTILSISARLQQSLGSLWQLQDVIVL